MGLQFASTLRDAINAAIISAVGPNGTLKLYSGAPPANVAAALSGTTLLASLPCSATFGTTDSGNLTLNAITQTNAAAGGEATFFRFTTSDGTATIQGTVGTANPDPDATQPDLVLNTVTIAAGGPVVINSFTMTAPGA